MLAGQMKNRTGSFLLGIEPVFFSGPPGNGYPGIRTDKASMEEYPPQHGDDIANKS